MARPVRRRIGKWMLMLGSQIWMLEGDKYMSGGEPNVELEGI
jgi:hypothetical protein